MNKRVLITLALCWLVTSCDDGGTITTAETRDLASLDKQAYPTNPTSEERFESPTSADSTTAEPTEPTLAYTTPEGWVEEKTSMFRSVNMSLKPRGEVYVSEVGGGLLQNINRWYGQFGAAEVTLPQLESGDRVTLLGENGYLVKATGDYNPGMGKPVMKGAMLVGAIAEIDGGLVTVKMIAPPAVAERELDAFQVFCNSLKR